MSSRQAGTDHGALGHHVHDADGQLVQQRIVVRVTEVNYREYLILSSLTLSTQDVLLIEVSMNDALLQLILRRLDQSLELQDDVLCQPPLLRVSDGEGEAGEVRDGGQEPDGVSVIITRMLE